MVSPTSKVHMTKDSPKTRSRSKPTKRSKTNAGRTPRKVRGLTKHDRVLGLLRGKRGATIAAISSATGWQPHSVRGFLAGVIKKKLGLILVSEKTKLGRVYCIRPNRLPVAAQSTEMTQERSRA
jgi:hypothetical protein